MRCLLRIQEIYVVVFGRSVCTAAARLPLPMLCFARTPHAPFIMAFNQQRGGVVHTAGPHLWDIKKNHRKLAQTSVDT